MDFHYTKIVNLDFQKAIDKVTEALKEQGFGVLTEIDVQSTLKNKIDVDFRPYKILGACNPHFAHKALTAVDKIGVFLPCNVVVQVNVAGKTEVSAVSPMASMITVESPKLAGIAYEVEERLKSVIASL
jgi:uncharacterized protein (DUF302 family)